MTEVQLYSEAFCDATMDMWTARPTMDLFEQWMRQHPTSTRLFARIRHPFQLDDSFLVAVGDPVHSHDFQKTLFLPQWIVQANQYSGCGEETTVTVIGESDLPKATRIVVRPVDSMLFQSSDVIGIFEQNLSRLGCLQQGKLYPLPILELNTDVSFFVEVLEPEGEVFLDGDEIPLEFESAVDSPPPPPAPVVRPPTPPPVDIPRLVEQGAAMIPDIIRASVPIAARPPTRQRTSYAPTGFVPFSGEGRRLNG